MRKTRRKRGFSQENADKVSGTQTVEQLCAGGFSNRLGGTP
jgi:hypothetical protein